MECFDRIVIGLGGVGSAALYQLAQRGACVLGVEQFGIAHGRGSSHGESRIMRQAYFEHSDYVPLLRRADALWNELEDESQKKLLLRTGLLEVGPADGMVISGIERSVAQHGLSVDRLEAKDVADRFPAFRVPDEMTAILERDAGLLLVEECVAAHVELAARRGAVVISTNGVRELKFGLGQVVVCTGEGDFRAGGLIVCGGAWSPALVPLPVELNLLRKHMHWFSVDAAPLEADNGAPCFFYDSPQGFFYGFPSLGAHEIKVAEHGGGTPIDRPDQMDAAIDLQDATRVRDFVNQYLAVPVGRRTRHQACMYSVTPDEHFIVDDFPGQSLAVFAAGLSGHGFKFAPVLGEVLAQLSLDGSTEWPIDFLRQSRFASR